MDQFLSQYWPNFVGTVTGGVTLSFLFFLLKERLFSLPQVSGIWEAQLTTASTSWEPFKGMRLWYRITLIQSGSIITGVGEINREDSAKGFYEYKANGKRRIEIKGTIEKGFTKSDVIHIMWIEHGQNRQFSNVFKLNLSGTKNQGDFCGDYVSTAANSKGFSYWKRIK